MRKPFSRENGLKLCVLGTLTPPIFYIKRLWVVQISSQKGSPSKRRKENFIRQWHSFFQPAWSLKSNGAVNSVENENYIP